MIFNFIFIVISWIARVILYILGWSPVGMTKERLSIFHENFKGVFVISHTSYLDGLIFVLYRIGYSDIFGRSTIVIKPQIFEMVPVILHPILKAFGFVKSTKIENTGEGFVNTTVNTLSEKETYLFFISPKGARYPMPWRSGYYNIAKLLNVPIVVCGFDYIEKIPKFFDPIYPDYENESREEIEKILKEKMGEIIPLHPERSEVELKSYNKELISIYESYSVFIFLAIMIFIIILWWKYNINPIHPIKKVYSFVRSFI